MTNQSRTISKMARLFLTVVEKNYFIFDTSTEEDIDATQSNMLSNARSL